MALIEGEEITHRDLLPVFDGFIKDLDEVRIGILKHLADFLRVSFCVKLSLGSVCGGWKGSFWELCIASVYYYG